MANNSQVWLQVEQENETFVTEAFTGIPVAQPSWICLASSGSKKGLTSIQQLREEITAVFLSANAKVQRSIIDVPHPDEMCPDQIAGRRKVLVLVASDDAQFEDLPWYQNWSSDAGNAFVMTVLPDGSFGSFFTPSIAQNDEHLLSRINATRWSKAISEAVPAILARADVTASVARIFISYRRLETLPLALQLFDHLTYEGFEVFLDRFSIPPGHDFQRRLSQELENKSMVLFLESRYAKSSKWTQHEIDFVKRNRLGLYALRMPDVDRETGLASFRPDALRILNENHFVTSPKVVQVKESVLGKQLGVAEVSINEWPALKETILTEVVAAVKATHAQALFRRRHRLREDLVVELRKRGVQTEYAAAGPLLAKYGPDEHLLWPLTRPAAVEDFRSTYLAHNERKGVSPKSLGILIGPHAAQEPDRQAHLQWLWKVSGCPSYDEGKLAEFADRLVKGEWA